MSLLSRNSVATHTLAPAPSIAHTTDTGLQTKGPFSKTFIVPNISTPWELVNYYKQQLSHKQTGGVPWAPPLGWKQKIYLRAAQELLDMYGSDIAVRTVVHAISIARSPPSLQWIIQHAEEVARRCNHPIEEQLTLLG